MSTLSNSPSPLPDISELGPSKRHITLGGGGAGIHTLNMDYSLSTLWASGRMDPTDRTSPKFGRKNHLRNSANLKLGMSQRQSPAMSLMSPSPISRSRAPHELVRQSLPAISDKRYVLSQSPCRMFDQNSHYDLNELSMEKLKRNRHKV